MSENQTAGQCKERANYRNRMIAVYMSIRIGKFCKIMMACQMQDLVGLGCWLKLDAPL